MATRSAFRFQFGDSTSLSEDLFADTRMSFGDHLEELRGRLWRGLGAFALFMALVFFLDVIGYLTGTSIGIGKPVMVAIAAPVEHQLQRFYDRRIEKIASDIQAGKYPNGITDEVKDVPIELDVQELIRELARRMDLPKSVLTGVSSDKEYVTFHGRISPFHWSVALSEAQRWIGKRPTLKTMSITEAMMVYFKVALACGFVLGSPWVFGQIWGFVAAGLYPHEKRLVRFYLPFSLSLFVAGILVCQFVILPRVIETLLAFNEWLDLDPDLRLNEWLGFAVMMPLVFGVAFQTPLVMLFLKSLGFISAVSFRRKRRLAWLLMAVAAAVMNPSPDLWSMLFLWIPLGLLYELGILLCGLTLSAEHQND
jgi:sec-independent protein translocase protein TatC